TFAYVRSMHRIIPLFMVKWFRPLMRALLDKEIRLDVDILEGLASRDPSIEGMKLSRFDRVLGLNRERLDRVYRGRPARVGAQDGTPGSPRRDTGQEAPAGRPAAEAGAAKSKVFAADGGVERRGA